MRGTKFMNRRFIDNDPESIKLKKELKENILRDLSEDFTPAQISYLGKVFDDVTGKYKFERKISRNIGESML